MFLEQTESLDDMLEENAIEPSEGDILAGTADEDGTVETDAPTALSILKASGSDYTVNLFYDATSGIPEGAALAVSEITQDAEEYPNYLEETKKAMGLAEEETLPYFAARFFDIKIMDGDEELTPETGVSVFCNVSAGTLWELCLFTIRICRSFSMALIYASDYIFPGWQHVRFPSALFSVYHLCLRKY